VAQPVKAARAQNSLMWQPDQLSVQQLAQLLEQTQQPASDQRDVLGRLDSHKGSEDFNNYLGYIFALGEDYSEVVRPRR
jgi:hypothetical protein